MKKIWKALAACLLSVALSACGSGGSRSEAAPAAASPELFCVNVGKGDALILRVGGWRGLIDAGKPWAMGRVRGAMEVMGIDALDAVFLTHTDKDHAGGLEWLAAGDIPVGAWYASGYYTDVKEDGHPAVEAAGARGQRVNWLTRGDVLPLGDTGAVLRVLAPFELSTDKDDNNSLVMMLETDQGRMLLTGDMELPEEAGLLKQGDDLSCDVLKAPNHGDSDTLSQAFARAAGADLAVISTDSYEKPGTPDPGVLARLKEAGTQVRVTQDAGLGVWVTLAGGVPEVRDVPFPEDEAQGLSIEGVYPGDDLIVMKNDGPDRDMTGWYLFSEKGNELFAFPEGTLFPSGGTLTVGTLSSNEGSYDLLWNDKKVIHQKKADGITLYDRYGRAADRRGNGL